jgi:hypothetical protein
MFAIGYWLNKENSAGLKSKHQAGALNIINTTFKVW